MNKRLTQLWLLLILFNIFLNLDPVAEWAEKEYSQTASQVSSEICLNDSIKKEVPQNESILSLLTITLALSSSEDTSASGATFLAWDFQFKAHTSTLSAYKNLASQGPVLSQQSRAPPRV